MQVSVTICSGVLVTAVKFPPSPQAFVVAVTTLSHYRVIQHRYCCVMLRLAVILETYRQRRTSQHTDRHVTTQQHIPARDLSSTTAANPSSKICRNSQCEMISNLYICPVAFACSSNPSLVEISLAAIIFHEVNSIHFFSQRKHLLVAPS